MNFGIKIAGVISLLLCLVMESQAQIIAITSDGKKVILSSDGTWKYEFENDGRKVVFNHDGTWKYETLKDTSRLVVRRPVVDSLKVAALDSVKMIPVKPPVKKEPPNLNCSALVAVRRDLTGDSFVAESKKFIVNDDLKNGFVVSWMNTKKGPLTWSTTLESGGHCIGEDNKIIIVFKDGRRIQLPHDGKNNCNSTFQLNFLGVWGKEETLDMLKTSEINSIRVYTSNGYVDAEFSEDSALRFRAATNCIVNR